VSTTQVLVGAVLGVGLARGLAALDTRVINKIFLSWLITLPAGAIMSIVFFFIIKSLFGA
jgi:PiT family inorganic phosphate transporter